MSTSFPNHVDWSPTPRAVGTNLGDASEGSLDCVDARSPEEPMAQLSISHLRSEHNSLLPISLLPAELLCRVFFELRRMAYPSRERSTSSKILQGWVVVTHVCCSWRSIAFDCASLWTDIPLHLGQEWAEAFTIRSKTAPIRIPIMLRLPVTSWQYNLVSAQISRIEIIDLVAAPVTDLLSFFDLIKTRTPNKLVDLRLRLKGDFTLSDEYSQVLHQATQLRHIVLANISLPWNMLPWTRLQSVDIVFPEPDHFSLSDLSLLTTPLASAAALEVLKLSVFACHFQTPATSLLATVHLSKLREFMFKGHATDFNLLLNAIRIPTTARLFLLIFPNTQSDVELSAISGLLRAQTGYEPSEAHGCVRALHLISDYGEDEDEAQLKAWQTIVDHGLNQQQPDVWDADSFIHVTTIMPENDLLHERKTSLQILCKSIRLDFLCQLRLSLFVNEPDNMWDTDTWHSLFALAYNVEYVRVDGPWVHRFFQALLNQQESDATNTALEAANKHGSQSCSLFPSLSLIFLAGFKPTLAFTTRFGSLSGWVERRAQHAPIKTIRIRNSTIDRDEIAKLRAITGLEVDWDSR